MNSDLKITKNRLLTYKLLAYILSFSIIFALIQSAVQLKQEYDNDIALIQNSLTQIEKTHLKPIASSLWQLDYEQTKVQIQGAMKLPGIIYIKILDNSFEDNNEFLTLGEKNTLSVIEKKYPLVYLNGNVKNKIGTMVVQASTLGMKEKFFNKIIFILASEAVKIFSLSLFIILIVHNLIIRHLGKMAEYAQELDLNRLDTPLVLDKKAAINKYDAIDMVVSAINKMRKNMLIDIQQKEEARKKLSIANKRMEEEIKVRKKIEKEVLEQKIRTEKQYDAIVKLSIEHKLFEKELLEGLETVTEFCARTLNVERVSIWFLNENGLTLDCKDMFEKSEYLHSRGDKLEAAMYPKYIAALKSNIAIDAHDAIHDERTVEFAQEYLEKYNVVSMLDVPIRFHETVKGVICFEQVVEPREWKSDEISFANRISDQITNILTANEWKKAERKVKKLNEELENKVEERTKELIDTNAELEQTIASLKQAQEHLVQSEKMASLGSLVAGVAHEINTPVGMGLTGITHFQHITDELQKNYENDNMSQDEFEEYIKTSSELASSILANLRRAAEQVKSFKQVAVDQSSEDIREFDIKEYIEETLLSLRNKTKKTKHIISVNCPPNVKIKSYPGAFSQIVTNLLMNSLIHGYDKDDAGHININVSVEGDTLTLIYQDDGKGIKKERLTKVFDPFFTTNREGGGSGLGLNILYNIATNQLRGAIKCESEENEGVLFIITAKINYA